VTISSRVFKFNASSSVCTHDDLQLVVPTIGARSRLSSIWTELQRSAEHVLAQLSRVLWLAVVHADDEEGRIDDFEFDDVADAVAVWTGRSEALK